MKAKRSTEVSVGHAESEVSKCSQDSADGHRSKSRGRDQG